MCVRACVRARACVCVRACLRAFACACVRVGVFSFFLACVGILRVTVDEALSFDEVTARRVNLTDKRQLVLIQQLYQ